MRQRCTTAHSLTELQGVCFALEQNQAGTVLMRCKANMLMLLHPQTLASPQQRGSRSTSYTWNAAGTGSMPDMQMQPTTWQHTTICTVTSLCFCCSAAIMKCSQLLHSTTAPTLQNCCCCCSSWRQHTQHLAAHAAWPAAAVPAAAAAAASRLQLRQVFIVAVLCACCCCAALLGCCRCTQRAEVHTSHATHAAHTSHTTHHTG